MKTNKPSSAPRPPRLRQANEPVTRATFDRLPMLLRASEVKWATGWSDAELAAEVATGRVQAVRNARQHARRVNGRSRPCQGNYQKYTKLSVARVLGFPV